MLQWNSVLMAVFQRSLLPELSYNSQPLMSLNILAGSPVSPLSSSRPQRSTVPTVIWQSALTVCIKGSICCVGSFCSSFHLPNEAQSHSLMSYSRQTNHHLQFCQESKITLIAFYTVYLYLMIMDNISDDIFFKICSPFPVHLEKCLPKCLST